MSVRIMSRVYEVGPTNAKERSLLLAIADHADESGFAFPGIALLARKVCASERTVIRHLEMIEKSGWLKISRRSCGPSRKGNCYQLDLAKLGVLKGDQRGLESDATSGESRAQRVAYFAVDDSRDKDSQVHVTERSVHVTTQHSSGDKSASYIRKNHQESPHEPLRGDSALSHRDDSQAELGAYRGYARQLFEQLAVVASRVTIEYAAAAIRFVAKSDEVPPQQAMLVIVERARAAEQLGATINRFWFEDSKWKASKVSKASVGLFIAQDTPETDLVASTTPATVPNALDAEEGRKVWAGIKATLKATVNPRTFDTWIRHIRALRIRDRVLILELPSHEYSHVPDQYSFASHLPSDVLSIEWVVEREMAA